MGVYLFWVRVDCTQHTVHVRLTVLVGLAKQCLGFRANHGQNVIDAIAKDEYPPGVNKGPEDDNHRCRVYFDVHGTQALAYVQQQLNDIQDSMASAFEHHHTLEHDDEVTVPSDSSSPCGAPYYDSDADEMRPVLRT